jgi:hypothetical protein
MLCVSDRSVVALTTLVVILGIGISTAYAQEKPLQEYSARTFGTEGSGPGQFFQPWAIEIPDIDGIIFVADRIKYFDDFRVRIQLFIDEKDKTPIQWYTTKEASDIAGGLNEVPLDISQDGVLLNLYVADPVHDEIIRYSLNSPEQGGLTRSIWKVKLSENETKQYLESEDPRHTPNPELIEPTEIAADGMGNVYVFDAGNNRVQKYTSSGKLLGLAPLTTFNVADMTAEKGGSEEESLQLIFMADRMSGIHIFDNYSRFAHYDTIPLITDDASIKADAIAIDEFTNDFYALDTSKEIIRHYHYGIEHYIKDIHYNDIEGVTIGSASDIAVNNDKIYVTDEFNHEVVILTPKAKSQLIVEDME